jgi:hypothetical protein
VASPRKEDEFDHHDCVKSNSLEAARAAREEPGIIKDLASLAVVSISRLIPTESALIDRYAPPVALWTLSPWCAEVRRGTAEEGLVLGYRSASVLNLQAAANSGPGIANFNFKRHIEIRYLLV